MLIKMFRKYRENQKIRDKYAEIKLLKNDFIYPYFVVNGKKIKNEIKNFYDIYHFSPDAIIKDMEKLINKGINKFLLFGVIQNQYKDEYGRVAYSDTEKNPVINAVKIIKRYFPNVCIITDVCLCSYTKHGHCGIIKNKIVDNNETVNILSKIALLHAQYGVDIIAPSAMMDGQVYKIRQTLDQNGFRKTQIMSYSAKYASNFYGPFRNAAYSKPLFGDRKTYQMDYRNAKQAIEEIKQDIKEGADIVMIKPANLYLDIIYRTKRVFPHKTVAAFQVSGEYMMIKLMIERNLLKEKDSILEALISIKRAGADLIISYFTKDIIKWL